MIPACQLSSCGRTGHPGRGAVLLRRDKRVLSFPRSSIFKTLAMALDILFRLVNNAGNAGLLQFGA